MKSDEEVYSNLDVGEGFREFVLELHAMRDTQLLALTSCGGGIVYISPPLLFCKYFLIR